MSVIVEQVGDTVVVSFSRPPANAFDLPLVEELAARLREIGATPPRGGLVVTGRGAAFSGGVDFKAVPRYGPAERARMVQATARKAADWLVAAQHADGSWDDHNVDHTMDSTRALMLAQRVLCCRRSARILQSSAQ